MIILLLELCQCQQSQKVKTEAKMTKAQPKSLLKAKFKVMLPQKPSYLSHSPWGQLKRAIQDINNHIMSNSKTGRVKVVETLGTSQLDSLGNQAPWKTEECIRSQCLPCKSNPGSCLKANITYQIM